MNFNKVIKSIASVSFITLISRILGYIRDAIIAAQIGTSIYNDIFIASFKLANLFRTLFGEGAFNSAFVPTFSGLLITKGKSYALRFASKMQAILILSLILFSVIMIIIMPLVINVTTPGFIGNSKAFSLTVELSRITFPYLFFISLAAFYGGIMNSSGLFAPFSATSIILNLVMIIAILLTKYTLTPAHALSYGVLIAGILELAWMLYFAKRYNLLVSWHKPKITKEVSKTLKNMVPSIIGSGVTQINIWIDMLIVSFIPGGMSYLYFSDRVMQLPLALIGTAIGIVMLPTLTQAIKSDNNENIAGLMQNSFNLIIFFSLPAAVGLVYLANDIVILLFMHGNFTINSVINTSNALIAFSIGLPAFIINKLLISISFAHGDSKTPVKVAWYTIISNAIISILLLEKLSHVGVALASSISAWINIFFLSLLLYKKKQLQIKKIPLLIEVLKYFISAVLMLLLLMLIRSNYSTSIGWFEISLLIIASAVIYLTSAIFLKTELYNICAKKFR